mmetsp:Transcript_6265/g.14992  ORF Transcript_6265/g.14992 Transcript_6265/m.14992 type:complete len:497 (-) Transcript_6265:145-1635(-)
MGCAAAIHRIGARKGQRSDGEQVLLKDVPTEAADQDFPKSVSSTEGHGHSEGAKDQAEVDDAPAGDMKSTATSEPKGLVEEEEETTEPEQKVVGDPLQAPDGEPDETATDPRGEGEQMIWGGCRVQTMGLQAAPEWNGLIGTALYYDEAVSRWRVLMPDSTIKMIKPQNLTLYSVSETPRKGQEAMLTKGPSIEQLVDEGASPSKARGPQSSVEYDEALRADAQDATSPEYDAAVEADPSARPSSIAPEEDEASKAGPCREEELTRLLERFDGNGKGVVPRATLIRVLNAATPTASAELLEQTIAASGAASDDDGVKISVFTRFLYAERRQADSEADPSKGLTSTEDGAPMVYDDGSEYRGQLSGGGHRQGRGTWTSAQSVYEGEFHHDAKHGYGVQKWVDGCTYEGDFKEGRCDGHGRMTWTSEAGQIVYEGEYHDDLKHGHGVFTWADGRSYDGKWKNGKRHGSAKYTFRDGTRRLGHWTNDKFDRWEVSEDIA